MARDVQITIVTFLWCRCRFPESLKGITCTLSTFTEDLRIRFYMCILFEQQQLCTVPFFFIHFKVKKYKNCFIFLLQLKFSTCYRINGAIKICDYTLDFLGKLS